MTSCCCSSTVSVILQSCKDQEIFIRCWYVKPYNWKQLLFSELYIYEKLYCRALLCFTFAFYFSGQHFMDRHSTALMDSERGSSRSRQTPGKRSDLQWEIWCCEKFKWEIIQRWALWSPRDKVSEVSHLWAWVSSMYCLENVKIWTTF